MDLPIKRMPHISIKRCTNLLLLVPLFNSYNIGSCMQPQKGWLSNHHNETITLQTVGRRRSFSEHGNFLFSTLLLSHVVRLHIDDSYTVCSGPISYKWSVTPLPWNKREIAYDSCLACSILADPLDPKKRQVKPWRLNTSLSIHVSLERVFCNQQ